MRVYIDVECIVDDELGLQTHPLPRAQFILVAVVVSEARVAVSTYANRRIIYVIILAR
jgi:hypothetical protein